MARTRSIKPGFFTNDELAEVDPLGRLLFAGLWTLADRDGRLLDRPKKIKAELLPYDACDADALLAALAVHGFIIRYAVGEQQLIQVANWAKHQQPHINEKPSELPPPPSATVPVPSAAEAITPAQEPSTRAVPEEHGTSTVLVPEQNGSNQPGTRYPVPGTLPPFNRELEDGAPDESAADAAPPIRAAPKKSPGPSLAPLVEAFATLGLRKPLLEGGEAKAAQSLLRHYPPLVLAQCWQDIAAGEYGDGYSQRELSFSMLSQRQRVENWQRWKAQPAAQRVVNGHARASPARAGPIGRQDWRMDDPAEIAAMRDLGVVGLEDA